MSIERDDPALQALLLPLATGALAWPAHGGALFLRARDGAPLRQWARPDLVCEQSFRPAADALARSGWTLRVPDGAAGIAVDADDAGADEGERVGLVLVLPPRQRQEARALLARAVARCAPGGVVVASVANDEGAKSVEADLRQLAGLSGSLCKHHCRVFWARIGAGTGTAPQAADAAIDAMGEAAAGDTVAASAAATPAVDAARLAQWHALDAPRRIDGGRFLSRPGVFAWDRIDPASRLLAGHLPADLRGRAADLGAGYGYLSDELLRRCPGITALDVYEAEARALALARVNLADHAARLPVGFHWHDVAGGLPQAYDVIVCNPPFHAQQRAGRPDIGRAFIAVAAAALVPGGRLWLVANRHLGYEAVLDASFGQVRTVAQAQGFKVIEAVKAAGGRR